MPELYNVDIEMQGSILIFLLLLTAGFFSVHFMYRSTVPPLPTSRKMLLAVMRAVAIFIVMMMIFTPQLSYSTLQKLKPKIAILIDRSESVLTSDPGDERTDKIVNSASLAMLDETFVTDVFLFGRDVEKVLFDEVDSLELGGDGTDLANAINVVSTQQNDQNYSAMVLISDGIHNVGSDPVRTAIDADIPLFTFPLGDPSPRKDLSISRVNHNEVAYTGKEVEFKVNFQSVGYGGKNSSVVISSGDLTESKIVNLTEENFEQSVIFKATPQTPGLQRFVIEIERQAGESNTRNNKRDIYMKVLDSGVDITVFAGRPSTDYRFLVESLKQDENFTVTGVVQRSGSFYQEHQFETLIAKTDIYIFVDFPRSGENSQVVNKVIADIIERDKPLLYIRGKAPKASDIAVIRRVLDLSLGSQEVANQDVYIKQMQGSEFHPVMILDDNQTIWDKIPPVNGGLNVIRPLGETDILAVFDQNRIVSTAFVDVPAIFSGRFGERKLLFVNFYNIWKWKFLSNRNSELEGVYDKFFKNAVRWLVNRDESKRVRIATDKDIYRSGEPIHFFGQVYSEQFEPVAEAGVTALLKSGDIERTLILSPDGRGGYEVMLPNLAPGEYSYSGEAQYEGRNLGVDNGSIAVREFKLESMQSKADHQLLLRLASSTNGSMILSDSLETLAAQIDSTPIEKIEKHEFRLWGRYELYFIILAMFCLEWFFRKRWGLL